MTSTVFEDVVRITENYLGPTAERFVARQVKFHLNKKPEELAKVDLPQLAEWVKVSLALLTEDKSMVSKFSKEIEKI